METNYQLLMVAVGHVEIMLILTSKYQLMVMAGMANNSDACRQPNPIQNDDHQVSKTMFGWWFELVSQPLIGQSASMTNVCFLVMA